MTEQERKRLEKELQGCKAKLKWTHIDTAPVQARISEIEEKLRDETV